MDLVFFAQMLADLNRNFNYEHFIKIFLMSFFGDFGRFLEDS